MSSKYPPVEKFVYNKDKFKYFVHNSVLYMMINLTPFVFRGI